VQVKNTWDYPHAHTGGQNEKREVCDHERKTHKKAHTNWAERNISLVAKEVLIKFVSQAI
jgi:hypothetical protein